jgi:hypothetical protein
MVGQTSDNLATTNRALFGINGTTDSIISMRFGGTLSGFLWAQSGKFQISSNNAPIAFNVGSAGNTEAMRIQNDGKIAIGTTTATFLFDVAGQMRSTTDAVIATTSGNLYIGTTSIGTSANRVIAIVNGTAPTTSPTDVVQMYANDITAGNAALHVRTEGGAVIKLYQQTTGVAAAAFVENSGTAVNDASTFGGYTLKQIVQALQNAGFLS